MSRCFNIRLFAWVIKVSRTSLLGMVCFGACSCGINFVARFGSSIPLSAFASSTRTTYFERASEIAALRPSLVFKGCAGGFGCTGNCRRSGMLFSNAPVGVGGWCCRGGGTICWKPGIFRRADAIGDGGPRKRLPEPVRVSPCWDWLASLFLFACSANIRLAFGTAPGSGGSPGGGCGMCCRLMRAKPCRGYLVCTSWGYHAGQNGLSCSIQAEIANRSLFPPECGSSSTRKKEKKSRRSRAMCYGIRIGDYNSRLVV